MNTSASKPYLTLSETAKILKISPNTLKTWKKKNYGPSYSRIGKKILYSWDDLSLFFNRNKIEISKA